MIYWEVVRDMLWDPMTGRRFRKAPPVKQAPKTVEGEA